MNPEIIAKRLREAASAVELNPSISEATSRLKRIAELVPAPGGSCTPGFFPEMEGNLSSGGPQMVATLNQWLNNKYRIYVAYRSFASRVTGPWRDSLVDHWHDHAEDEQKQAYDIAMKIVSLKGDPVQTTIEVPNPKRSVTGFCQALCEMELTAIQTGRKVIEMAGDHAPTRILAERIIDTDAHHLDDLRRMCMEFNL